MPEACQYYHQVESSLQRGEWKSKGAFWQQAINASAHNGWHFCNSLDSYPPACKMRVLPLVLLVAVVTVAVAKKGGKARAQRCRGMSREGPFATCMRTGHGLRKACTREGARFDLGSAQGLNVPLQTLCIARIGWLAPIVIPGSAAVPPPSGSSISNKFCPSSVHAPLLAVPCRRHEP